VRAAAWGLSRLGVAPGEVVSWQLPNWHEALVLHHAVLRLGAVSNPIVPIYRHHEVGQILARPRSRVAVVPGVFRGFDHAEMLRELRPGLPELAHVVIARPEDGGAEMSFADLLDGGPADGDPADGGSTRPGPPPPPTADDPMLLLFTSGTTADPKGVLHTHNTLDYENQSIIDLYGLGPGDIVFMPSPVSHITGLLYGLQLPPMLGTTVVMQDVWDPSEALRLIERHRCSFTVAATPFLHGLAHHPRLAHHDVRSLRVFACGGADVPSALIEEAGRRLGCAAMRIYGSTEFPTLSASAPEAPLAVRAGTDGRPIGAAEFRIVDDDGAEVAPGETGELVVRGPELFLGYLREPGEADGAGEFTPDGYFHTGDLATSHDGHISIRGRKKDIILRGGENISVTEVEDLLFRHPAVREVAVVAMPDPVMVERGCAFVVPEKASDPPALEELVRYLLTKRIAKQKLPERLELVGELPKTQSGKVQKFRLREIVRDRLAGRER
jgi:cyclohexanecarboxylate-CoA ligase